MQLFYQPDFKYDQTSVAFNKEESRHITKVLRNKEGDSIYITNGNGIIAQAELGVVTPKHCEAFVLQAKKHAPLPYNLHLAVAPTKSNDRFEWFLEKATEIGITEITPLLCHHSERKQINWDRYQKIVVSAVKQSLKAYVPKLNQLTDYKEFIKMQQGKDSTCLIAHCYEEEKVALKQAIASTTNLTIAIGPEGDFIKEELQIAGNANFKPISLGEQRLRTETAAVVACTAVAITNS